VLGGLAGGVSGGTPLARIRHVGALEVTQVWYVRQFVNRAQVAFILWRLRHRERRAEKY
jgi:hypothetical protein